MNVCDASAAGALRPRGADGHRSRAGRLRGALPQVRDRGSGAGDLRRSAASTVGARAGEDSHPAEVFALYFPLGWLRWRGRLSWI
jgi:hypothetical protein